MLKIIFLAVFLFSVSILTIDNAALSSPLLHGTFIAAQTLETSLPSKVKPSSESAIPQASESAQTNQKSTPVESKISEKEENSIPEKSSNTQSDSGGPYDMESIKAFNRALYGS